MATSNPPIPVIPQTPELSTPLSFGPARPAVLFPVRLETRFFPQTDGGVELRVRVYPDAIHVDSHEPELTAEEVDWGQHFWEQTWRAGERRRSREAPPGSSSPIASTRPAPRGSRARSSRQNPADRPAAPIAAGPAAAETPPLFPPRRPIEGGSRGRARRSRGAAESVDGARLQGRPAFRQRDRRADLSRRRRPGPIRRRQRRSTPDQGDRRRHALDARLRRGREGRHGVRARLAQDVAATASTSCSCSAFGRSTARPTGRRAGRSSSTRITTPTA